MKPNLPTDPGTARLRILIAEEPPQTLATSGLHCPHCGGEPLVLSVCCSRRICAICQTCGYHIKIKETKSLVSGLCHAGFAKRLQ